MNFSKSWNFKKNLNCFLFFELRITISCNFFDIKFSNIKKRFVIVYYHCVEIDWNDQSQFKNRFDVVFSFFVTKCFSSKFRLLLNLIFELMSITLLNFDWSFIISKSIFTKSMLTNCQNRFYQLLQLLLIFIIIL